MGRSLEEELSLLDEQGFELELRLLEDAHARARTPKARRRIERKAREAQREIEKLREQAKVVDLAYERWRRKIEAILKGDM